MIGNAEGWLFEALQLTSVRDQVFAFFTNTEMWLNVLYAIIKIIAIYIGGRIILRISSKVIHRMVIEREQTPLKFDARRTKTIGKLINNVLTYTINFLTILMILSQLDFKLGPLLAGAGVVGLAIGFGAQSLVKDVITGFFIIFEDHFSVGDVVQIDQVKGTVEEIGLRVTRIKSWTGEIHIIPNGSINQVTNFSVNNSLAVIDVSIAYEENVDKAMEVIKETMAVIYKDSPDMVKEPEVLGVQALGASEVVIRVTAECKPMTHFPIARRANKEIKYALEREGIEIPYPKMVQYTRMLE